MRVELDGVGYKRLLTSLQLGKTPVWQYQYLAWGRVTDPLTVEQISALVNAIASKTDGGLSIAIDLLAMVIHCASEKDSEYRHNLANCCISFLKDLNWSHLKDDHSRIDHDIDVILNFALAAPCPQESISKILENLVTYERSESQYYSSGRGRLLSPFFKYYPLLTLDAIYVADDDGEYSTALRMVSRLESDRRETAIRAVPLDTIIEWCEISPIDRYVFAAETCRLFEKNSEGGAEVSLSEVVKKIVANAPDKKAVLDNIIDRFRPSGWTGSLAAILRSRLPLLATLNPDGDKELEIAIKQAEETFRKYINIEEAFEEERERRQTGSFE